MTYPRKKVYAYFDMQVGDEMVNDIGSTGFERACDTMGINLTNHAETDA